MRCFSAVRSPGNSQASAKEKWDMKILFILYCQRRISRLSLVLNTGKFQLSDCIKEKKKKKEYSLFLCPKICYRYNVRFKCIDLDGNGILTPNEMQFFYEEQLHRMECMAQEPVLFEDILCQMFDMIKPEVCHFHINLITPK